MNVETNTTADPGPAIDEVLRLCLRLQAAQEMEAHCQSVKPAQGVSGVSHRIYFDCAAEHAGDEYTALQDMISFTKATTLTGAALQVVEALNVVSFIDDCFPQDAESYVVKRKFRALDRLLHSIFDVVDGLADHKLADVTPSLLQSNLNPWTDVEARVADLQRGRAIR